MTDAANISPTMEAAMRTGFEEGALNSAEGSVYRLVDKLFKRRTLRALERRGLVTLEIRTLIDERGMPYLDWGAWLTEDGVALTRKLTEG
ncbi:hypothetical protein ACFW2V_12590 [Streptomyces sp. NPDC058947]|uniref:hypothetical protein n=1 Tax=Streptomyces sp. NPDC058947 TaxID=3346675 RepID=UPI0036A31EBE